jgi:prepilin-type N-terminal cleavage/methylation domain-containing protein
MKNKSKNKKGFSLLEVIISAFVLSVGITAVLGLMASNIKYSIDSRNSIIASELAQEGAELVRNIRDNNFLSSPSYPFLELTNANGLCIDKNTDTKGDPSLSCSNGNRLYYQSNFYSHNGTSGNETKFYRKINIADDSSGSGGKLVTSTVWWDGNSDAPSSCNIASRCISVIEILTDWN